MCDKVTAGHNDSKEIFEKFTYFYMYIHRPIIHAVETVYCLVKIYCDVDSDSSVYNSALRFMEF